MDYQFNKLSQEQADNIAFNWRYEGEFSFYNMTADEEDLTEFLNPVQRGDKYFIVTKDSEEVGFFYFEYEGDLIDVGLGIKPELTGCGLGVEFIKAGLDYAISKYNPREITLSVATFNKRAIKVYKKVGFKSIETFMQDTNGSRFEFLKMRYKCAN
ncbi:GNAT family N-acetyltransferase [Paraliobacillus salinarum]|uniref:GNAT family N-acetyltransferase n=1 Tax=Paraliobacillus salinarum TaxID=1158996 RepID=UPI0015F744CA|nr:GNAT family N-acetyltransferase [Paraliobacillus salinarum]